MNSFFAAFLVACIVTMVAGECPSACSGHGTCGAYDACSCFRNWMSNDCSERICPFGLAHVDTPMGDLDASSGQLTGPGDNAVPGSAGDKAIILNSDMYPSGVTEQYPAMKDSRGTILAESAHYYRECSNKGICDRSSGECECFEGYEGSSCQRASCPTSGNGECSGHGTCHTIQELAAFDHENVYRLWDEDITMGCKCDAGYTGPDCSSRTCKMGYDPLYYDDFQNVRHANYTVQFYVMNDDAVIYGNYSLVFTDVFGEDWETEPIDIDANCGVIQDRLESLPNDVIPWGTVKCYKSEESLHISPDTSTNAAGLSAGVNGKFSSFTNTGGNGQEGTIPLATGQKAPVWDDYMKDAVIDTSGDQARGETIYSENHYAIVNKFILAFPGNPGEIPPLKINRYLDGARPTLFSTETGDTLEGQNEEQTLGVHIYANGFHGETTDYVNDECEGVLVSLQSGEVVSAGTPVGGLTEKYSHYLGLDSDIEFERLKKCLGDSDGVSTNNVEVYDWDYGSFMNPHLIKLVDATQDRFVEYLRSDGSSYKVLAQDDTSHLSTPMGGGVGDTTSTWEKDTEGLGSFLNMPMSKLCSRGQPWQHDNYMDTNSKFPYRTTNTLEASTSLFEASKLNSENYNRGSYGWCRALDPPGFFAVVYYDDCTAFGVSQVHDIFDEAPDAYDITANMCGLKKTGFRLLTRPATDYSTSTKFHVFTTKGTLQQVSAHSGAYTQSYTERIMDGTEDDAPYTYNPDFYHSLHSNVIHTTNTSVAGAQGQVDCETALDWIDGSPKYSNYDCLNKGDKIFLIALGDKLDDKKNEDDYSHKNIAGHTIGYSYFYNSTANSLMANPLYPNMYTVEKIGKEVKNPNAADQTNLGELHAESYRQQITLNMGVNAQYMKPPAAENVNFPGVLATIYKFHPPALNSTGTTGYNYVGECSNRGICDSDSGICECFTGFTGQNCGVINSLAE